MPAIVPQQSVTTLAQLFYERAKQTPNSIAYGEYDHTTKQWVDYSWQQTQQEVNRWRAALQQENLTAGDRVAIRLHNCRHWIIFEQAALSLGLVIVPLYVADRADNTAYVIQHSVSKLLLVNSESDWREFTNNQDELTQLQRVITLQSDIETDDKRVQNIQQWLPASAKLHSPYPNQADDLATIVYTSGTTGRPKGVMLSHNNILTNAYAAIPASPPIDYNIFLSFLPLSHMLERTSSYLAILLGSKVCYARSVPDIPEDLQSIKPTMIISVPRIYERIYNGIQEKLTNGSSVARTLFNSTVDIGWHRFEYLQGRASWHPKFLLWPILNVIVAKKVHAKLGGNLLIAISGGAPLPPHVSRLFMGLGMTILQGYGLTESSPMITANMPQKNMPSSVGPAVENVSIKIGEDQEILAKGPNIMLGYWQNEDATKATIDEAGWLHTGDQGKIDDQGYLYITGRIKEIIVLSNGEKIPPSDMESAISKDTLFSQVMILGEGKPFLSALLVLDQTRWQHEAIALNLNPNDPQAIHGDTAKQFFLDRISQCLSSFPGYAQVRQITASLEPWSIENELLTPTMKLKRVKIVEYYENSIQQMYDKH